MTDFKDFYTAHNFSGYDTLLKEYYGVNAETTNPKIVNIQLRYWIEAVEKFERLNEEDYNEECLEEAILIVNLLGNSLLILGGMNVKEEKLKGKNGDETPDFYELYSGAAWNMNKTEKGKPLYKELVKDFIPVYNKISKHFNWTRKELLSDLTYANISKHMELVRNIWLWVIETVFGNVEDHMPDKLDYFFMRPYV